VLEAEPAARARSCPEARSHLPPVANAPVVRVTNKLEAVRRPPAMSSRRVAPVVRMTDGGNSELKVPHPTLGDERRPPPTNVGGEDCVAGACG
jgi:hypothetical protein